MGETQIKLIKTPLQHIGDKKLSFEEAYSGTQPVIILSMTSRYRFENLHKHWHSKYWGLEINEFPFFSPILSGYREFKTSQDKKNWTFFRIV